MRAPDEELVQKQRELILDPFDPESHRSSEGERRPGRGDHGGPAIAGVPLRQRNGSWRCLCIPEFRTLPMLFYVPPLLPVLSSAQESGAQRMEGDLFTSLENARLPVRYIAHMLAAGNDEPVIKAYQKMIAVRLYKRAQTVGDVTGEEAAAALARAGMTDRKPKPSII